MSRFYSFIIFLVMCLSARLFSQTAQERVRPTMHDLESKIQTELETHGERVLGEGAYRWSTRLDKISDCRAEFTVRITNAVGGTTVRTDNVRFSLGALETYGITSKKNGLELPCAGHEECIVTFSTCIKTTEDGITIDCTNTSRKREDSFLLQMDGDAAAFSRLEQTLRQAIGRCHEPADVRF